MLRFSPAEFYIKFLLIHPSNYSNRDIEGILKDSQLDFIGDDHLLKLRSLLTAPIPFYPQDKRHHRSQRFLIREKIQGLFHRDEVVRRAFDILESPRAKEFVESMSLSGAPSTAIATALTTQKRFFCTAEVVDKYLHYFWNLSLVDCTEIRAIISLRSVVEVREGDAFGSAKAKLLEKAAYNDSRRVAADLPNAPLVALLSQMRMGVMPNNIDLARALDAVQKAATLRSLEASLRGGYEDDKKASNYILTAKMAGEMLETVVKPDEKLREQLSTIALTTETRDVPTIKKLSNGKHTIDMAPPVRVEKEDEL